MEKDQSVTLLLLEAKAEWPTWGTQLRLNAAHCRVEVQQEAETLGAFHERVQLVLQKLKDEGQVLSAAGYVCSTDCTQTTSNARLLLCEHLLKMMKGVEEREPELTIAGGAWASSGHEGMARVTLMELWGNLSSLSAGPKLSVRFEDTALDHEAFDSHLRLSSADVVRLSPEAVGTELRGPRKVRLSASAVHPVLEPHTRNSLDLFRRPEELEKSGS